MRLLTSAALRTRIAVAVRTTDAWLVREAGSSNRVARDGSIERLTELLFKRFSPYAIYALNTEPSLPERLDDAPQSIRLPDGTQHEDGDVMVHLREGEECLHNPGYKTGAYFCCKPAGHKGPHDYVPSFLAIVTPLDGDPTATPLTL